jgi:hypothetical protein
LLRLATVTCAAFLERAEPIVSHGVAKIAQELIEAEIAKSAYADPASRVRDRDQHLNDTCFHSAVSLDCRNDRRPLLAMKGQREISPSIR